MRFDLAHERIRLARHVAEIKQTDCERYGVSLGTYKKWEKSVKITKKAAARLSAMFKNAGVLVSAKWLQCGVGVYPKKLNSPLQLISNTIHHELDFFKQLNQDKEIICTYPYENIDKLLDANDLIAGFVSIDEKDIIDKFCIVITEDNHTKIGYVKDVCFNENYCAFLLGDSFKFKQIAKVVWIRKF